MIGHASTPARFRPNFLTWSRCFPGRATFTLLPALLFAGLPVLAHFTSGAKLSSAAVFWLGVPILAVLRLREVWQKCTHGDINPAVVVSVRPCLIAVSTDMSKRAGDTWPVIKILPQPLRRVRGKSPQIGDRLPTVSLYQVTLGSPHWGDFSPVAIACLTDDEEAVRGAMRRLQTNEFGQDHWERLEQNLARVLQPYKPGLYWMRQR